MHIRDGIAYADGLEKNISVQSVRSLDNYRLWVHFQNDEVKTFDFTPLLDYPCYQLLKDKAVFSGAYVDYGIVMWNDGNIDIAPEKLYKDGILYSPQSH